MFDNVFETKKFKPWIKLNHNINTCEISGVSFFAKKKKISLSMKTTCNYFTYKKIIIAVVT